MEFKDDAEKKLFIEKAKMLYEKNSDICVESYAGNQKYMLAGWTVYSENIIDINDFSDDEIIEMAVAGLK